MVKLTPKIVLDGKAFAVDLNKCLISADASSCRFASTQRLWENSQDQGVYIRSHRTGEVVPFVHSSTIKDDGSVIAWKFRSVDPTVDLSAIIYND